MGLSTTQNASSCQSGQPAGEAEQCFDALGYLRKVAERITAGMIMTRFESLVCVEPHLSVRQALELMGRSYDQLPIVERGEYRGIIFRESLEGRSAAEPLTATLVHAEPAPSVGPDAPLSHVWKLLVRHTCLAVVHREPPFLRGLIHFSDLNRHLCRCNAYLWISALEMRLAELVQQECPDAENWLGSLDEHRQVVILGRQEYDRRHHSDLAATESLELSDLLRIVRFIPGLLGRLGYTRSQFDRKTGHLVKVRNSVMHPVRSFVRVHADVQKTLDAFGDLHEVLTAAEAIIGTGCSSTGGATQKVGTPDAHAG